MSNINGKILLTYPVFVNNVISDDSYVLNGFVSLLLNTTLCNYFNFDGNYIVFDAYGDA